MIGISTYSPKKNRHTSYKLLLGLLISLLIPTMGWSATDDLTLFISENADRSEAITLNGTGTPLDGEVAVFLDSLEGSIAPHEILFVQFRVNGHRRNWERRAPYDLGGTSRSGLARLLPTEHIFNEGPNDITAITALPGYK